VRELPEAAESGRSTAHLEDGEERCENDKLLARPRCRRDVGELAEGDADGTAQRVPTLEYAL
jgi:hypothetical protein